MKNVLQAIHNSKIIGLVSHISPDGDAIGSLVSLRDGLSQIGKIVQVVQKDEPPAIFNYLCPDQNQTLEFPPKLDLLIVVDLGDSQRTGFPSEVANLAKQNKLAVIDHHPKGDLSKLTEITYIKSEASSTSELVYDILHELGSKITPSLATALLTGLYTDTGGFQHPNTSNRAFDLAGELLRHGAKLQSINQAFTHNKSIASLKLLGIALERLFITFQDGLAVSVLTHEDIAAVNATVDDHQGIVSHLQSIQGIRGCLLLAEYTHGEIRGSMRADSVSAIPVGQLAKILGGGGHARAAGFSLPGHLRWENQTWEIVDLNSKKS